MLDPVSGEASGKGEKMNKRQEGSKNSFESVKKVMDDNSAVTAGISALNGAVVLFESDFAGIDALASKVSMNATRGNTAAKHDIEDVLVTMELPIITSLRSFARSTGNKQLFTEMDVSESDLVRMKDAEVTVFAKKVLGYANANADPLAKSYGISAAKLNAFKNQIDCYENAGQAQGAGVANRESAHESLKALIGKLNDDLDDIDDLMENVKADHPDFYNAYFDARPLKVLGIRHRKGLPPVAGPKAKPKDEK